VYSAIFTKPARYKWDAYIKMFLSFIHHNAMKKHEAVKVQLHASPVTEVKGGGRSASDSGCLTSKERELLPPTTHQHRTNWIQGRVGPTADLDVP